MSPVAAAGPPTMLVIPRGQPPPQPGRVAVGHPTEAPCPHPGRDAADRPSGGEMPREPRPCLGLVAGAHPTGREPPQPSPWTRR